MFEEIIEQIEFEITQIDHLLEVYGELFQRALQESALNVIELAALSSVVHSFYNGLENIFVNIAKDSIKMCQLVLSGIVTFLFR